MTSVSVIIPALNEEEPIAGVIHECFETNIPSEIVVVDNGSTDRTAERARGARAKVVSEPRHGYGRACLAGVDDQRRPSLPTGDHERDSHQHSISNDRPREACKPVHNLWFAQIAPHPEVRRR